MKDYQFHTEVSKEEFDRFVQNHRFCNLLQSYDWAKVKSNWEALHTGVYQDGKLQAVGLVLIKQLPLSFTMFYIPKGPILDFEDAEMVKFYFQALKKVARKRHCIFIKFDPGIVIREFTLSQKDAPLFGYTETILDNMKRIHAQHKGFTTYIEETVQPRFHMGLKPCDLDEHLPKSTKRSIKKATKKNVVVEEVGIKGLPEFAQIMHMTEERKNVHLRTEDYFRLLLQTYPTAHLYLAYVDLLQRKNELLQKKKELEAKIAQKPNKKAEHELLQNQEELTSIQKVCEKYPHKTSIAGGMMIGYGKEYEMLYAGSNDDFMNFRPQYLLYARQFQDAFANQAEFVTMGGVDGDFQDGLSEFKSNFAPYIREYIGEFDLPVHRVLYALAMKAMPMAKKMLKKKA